jgi:hypothetical protein
MRGLAFRIEAEETHASRRVASVRPKHLKMFDMNRVAPYLGRCRWEKVADSAKYR